MELLAVLERLQNVKPKHGGGYTARCPVHEDRQNSLSIDARDNRLLLHCFAGCDNPAIGSAIDVAMSDLFTDTPLETRAIIPARPIKLTDYEIRDRAGELVAVHVRRDFVDGTKRFAWRQPDGTYGLNGVPIGDLPLYGVHQLPNDDDIRIVVVEGEKARDALEAFGIATVATVTGASTIPSPARLAELGGRHLALWPDNDDAGRAHMDNLARALQPNAASIGIVSWAEAPLHRDAADYVGDPWDVIDAAELLDEDSFAFEALGSENQKKLKLRFYTLAELEGMTLTAPDWLAHPGLVAIGVISEIDGKVKRAGKTTFVLWMMRSILDGTPFLGWPTRRARVIYVTELTRQVFRDFAKNAGLVRRGDDLLVLFREDFGDTPWPEIVAMCRQDGYDLVVIDTIGKLSGIRDENDAASWRDVLTPLQDLAASGRAVVLLRHDRKGGGEVGDSGRGSSQASGDVDVILALRRPEGNQPTNRRVIESASRYQHLTPEKFHVELRADGYAYLGGDDAVMTKVAEELVLHEVAERKTGVTRDELETVGKRQEPPIRPWAIVEATNALEKAGKIAKIGAGVRGDPYRYTPVDDRTSEAPDVSFGTQTYGGKSKSNDVDVPAEALRIFGDDLAAMA
jgi:hypothetical protein